jgi:hypothetical protein
MIFEVCQAKVFTENKVTESCKISVGVRQGDASSIILLLLILDCVMKKLGIRGNMSTKMLQFRMLWS